MPRHEKLATIRGFGFTFTLFDTGIREGNVGAFGQPVLSYQLCDRGRVVAQGADYRPYRNLAIDSTLSIVSCLYSIVNGEWHESERQFDLDQWMSRFDYLWGND